MGTDDSLSKGTVSRATSAKIANMGIVFAFLVVCIHVTWPTDAGVTTFFVKDVFVRHVARYAVPYFFGVSGYLLAGRFGEPGWWLRAVRSRIVTLGVPFVIWSVLFLLAMACVDVVANLLAGREPLSAMRGAWGSVRIFMGMNLFHPPGLVPLWYVRNVLLLVAVSPLLKMVTQRLGWMSVGGIALAYVTYWMCAASGAVPARWSEFFNYGFSIEGLLCFVVGMVLRERGIRASLSGIGLKASFVVWLVAEGLAIGFTGRCVPWAPVFRLLSIAATVLFAWKAVPDTPWPKWFTSCAFPVYLLHCFVLDVCRLVPRLTAGTAGAWLQAFAELVIACLLPIVFCRMIGRCVPRLSSVLFGGRSRTPVR